MAMLRFRVPAYTREPTPNVDIEAIASVAIEFGAAVMLDPEPVGPGPFVRPVSGAASIAIGVALWTARAGDPIRIRTQGTVYLPAAGPRIQATMTGVHQLGGSNVPERPPLK